ncbi:MAG: competence protein [Rickettsiaceae bacterium]|jgi:ComF family protein|nr:competence protein [Rickettsiaceae bacterium]
MLDDNMLCSSCWSKYSFITKPYCICCGFPFSFEIEGQLLCGKCIKSPPYFDKARYLFKYNQDSKKLIHALKYNDQTHLAKIFAKLQNNIYSSEILQYDLIIPVPMHWLKRMFRMYNQASLLAKELGRLTNISVSYDNLVKYRWTKAQSTLKKDARQKNLQGSFTVREPTLLKGKKVILIDDVLTTGATVKECSKLLKKNGVKDIMVLTIAAT